MIVRTVQRVHSQFRPGMTTADNPTPHFFPKPDLRAARTGLSQLTP